MKDYENIIKYPISLEEREYLERYWLTEKEFLYKIKPIQNKIFNYNSFPRNVFQNKYKLYPTTGGIVLDEDYWHLIQKLSESTNDKNIFLIQDKDFFIEDTSGCKNIVEKVCLKYNINVSWEEIRDSKESLDYNFKNELVSMIYIQSMGNYFIFGDSAKWGIYTLNEGDSPFYIFGALPEYFSYIKNIFKDVEVDFDSLKKEIPKIYLKDSSL